MFVKICGLTNLEDALAAVESGATALGFNFVRSSPRFVEPEGLKAWISHIPGHIWKTGVFMDELPSRIEALARDLRLHVVQLHGNEKPENMPRNFRLWKAARVSRGFQLGRFDNYEIEALLLDGPASGVTFDWRAAAGAKHKVILAGGLDATNVREAIERVKPWGVDACSRIETVPGRKDHARMRQFIETALSC